MKTLQNGLQVEVLKIFRNASNEYKKGTTTFADLLKVKFATGKIGIICETEIDS
jgi:predicted nucleic-acid-binding protein